MGRPFVFFEGDGVETPKVHAFGCFVENGFDGDDGG